MLNPEDIRLVLAIIREQYGPGYSPDPEIAGIQGKLFKMLEAAIKMERARLATKDFKSTKDFR